MNVSFSCSTIPDGQLTPRVLQPEHCSYHAREQYHRCNKPCVSIRTQIHSTLCRLFLLFHLPDRQDATSLGKTSLLLNTADSLFEYRRNFSRRSFRIRSIGTGGLCGNIGGCGCGASSLQLSLLAGGSLYQRHGLVEITKSGARKLRKAVAITVDVLSKQLISLGD